MYEHEAWFTVEIMNDNHANCCSKRNYEIITKYIYCTHIFLWIKMSSFVDKYSPDTSKKIRPSFLGHLTP